VIWQSSNYAGKKNNDAGRSCVAKNEYSIIHALSVPQDVDCRQNFLEVDQWTYGAGLTATSCEANHALKLV
jgi:hypothetical protein